jgi:hypothetical protein
MAAVLVILAALAGALGACVPWVAREHRRKRYLAAPEILRPQLQLLREWAVDVARTTGEPMEPMLAALDRVANPPPPQIFERTVYAPSPRCQYCDYGGRDPRCGARYCGRCCAKYCPKACRTARAAS